MGLTERRRGGRDNYDHFVQWLLTQEHQQIQTSKRQGGGTRGYRGCRMEEEEEEEGGVKMKLELESSPIALLGQVQATSNKSCSFFGDIKRNTAAVSVIQISTRR